MYIDCILRSDLADAAEVALFTANVSVQFSVFDIK